MVASPFTADKMAHDLAVEIVKQADEIWSREKEERSFTIMLECQSQPGSAKYINVTPKDTTHMILAFDGLDFVLPIKYDRDGSSSEVIELIARSFITGIPSLRSETDMMISGKVAKGTNVMTNVAPFMIFSLLKHAPIRDPGTMDEPLRFRLAGEGVGMHMSGSISASWSIQDLFSFLKPDGPEYVNRSTNEACACKAITSYLKAIIYNMST